MKAAVIGLGKIGLPIAITIADAGIQVTGGDASPKVVEEVNSGRAPFPGEPGLVEGIQRSLSSGLLRATTDNAEAAKNADIIVVIVPMYVDDQGIPDYSILESVSRDIGSVLHAGQTVIYETTLPVGATRSRLAPILTEVSGLKAGHDFHVVHSPERVFSGRVFADLKRYPKIIGGLTPSCGDIAKDFYQQVLVFDDRPDLDRLNGVWDLGSVEAAEFAKLAETTYRDVNIALANEFGDFAERLNVDIHEIIDAANSQPFSHIHQPGIYVGGHCIPVYPRFYSSVDTAAKLPPLARQINDAGPERAVNRLEVELGSLQGMKIGVLGSTYRGGVKEMAFSGVFPLVEILERKGALPVVHDPMLSDAELESLGFIPFELGSTVNAIIVQADHPEYQNLGANDLGNPTVVLDGRRILDPSLFSGSTTLLTIGRG
jgi:UDP-N-acetyl-D-glucosamine dehydrogenase